MGSSSVSSAVQANDAGAGEPVSNPHAQKALEHHKLEGMKIAFRARIIAICAVTVLLPTLNPDWSVLYYMAFAFLFGINGWAQLRAATVEQSGLEVLLLAVDLILLTLIVIIPNPLVDFDQPLEMQYRYGGHSYMFLFLALGTLAYSWRTVRGYAYFGAITWSLGVFAIWMFSSDHPSVQVFQEAMAPLGAWTAPIDPGDIQLDRRIQEIVIFAIVAYILSLTVKRFSDLMLQQAATERERTNLARYFSPNMVENLSQNDDPLKQIKTQNVAVLFVDIVGFTAYSNDRAPQEVIETLREFHRMMEQCVFDNGGTLDKFLGDGMMVTFGTPEETDQDVVNALHCANSMAEAVSHWNAGRRSVGEQELKIGVGLHYGACVLGDIGGDNRLEFAVIGDTVNIASRVEAKTRELGVNIAITEAFADKVVEQSGNDPRLLNGFKRYENQEIRGISNSITLLGTDPATLH